LNNEWLDRRVLVTGGTGFLGQHLTRRLVELGAQVTVALCEEDGSQQTGALLKNVGARLALALDLRDGDVRNYGQMRRLVEAVAPEIIFHLAAVGVNDPFIAEETALRVNLHGTLNLLRAVKRVGVGCLRRVVVAGTCYEYGEAGQLDPGNVYAASKVAAWAFCRMYHRAHGTPVVIVRPFNVYGPGQNEQALIPSAIRAALSGQDFPMTPGEQRRDFVYVDDVIQGFLAVARANGIEGQTLDLGTGQATPVREVVERVFALVAQVGATLAVARPLVGALPYRPGVVWELVADAHRTRQLTGWRAKIGLEEGLQTTIEAMIET
jgi:UDP-glucose 4-epimerase